MADFYLGQIVLFAGNFVPVGWAACDGSLLSIADNDALFAIIGTTYGGDGVNTFALPDLRGAIPVSSGQPNGRSPYSLGQTGGAENVTITAAQMPAHGHTATISAAVNVGSKQASKTSPSGNYFAATGLDMYYPTPDSGATLNPRGVVTTATIGTAGGSQPVNTMAPYLVMTYCICTAGIFPSRP